MANKMNLLQVSTDFHYPLGFEKPFSSNDVPTVISDVIGDGNCGFRVISSALRHTRLSSSHPQNVRGASLLGVDQRLRMCRRWNGIPRKKSNANHWNLNNANRDTDGGVI